MEALSTPGVEVSAIRPGAFLSTNPRDPHLLRPPCNPSLPLYPALSNKPGRPSSLSRSFAPNPLFLLSQSPPRSPPLLKPPAQAHSRASTGYAAALLDAARCRNTIQAVYLDVRRFVRRVHSVVSDPSLDDERKEEIVRGVAEGGGFCTHLVALVRMLVQKGKVGLVGEVMGEFGRLYDELAGTRTVLMSSEGRMGDEELMGIARRVQRASGAVNVRVRHLICERSPSTVTALLGV